MNSIWLNSSFIIKTRESLLRPFVICYKIVVGSESTISGIYNFFFFRKFSTFCHEYVSTVFKCALVLSFAAEHKLVAHTFVTTICRATQTQTFSAPKYFLELSSLSYNKFFVFTTTRPPKKSCKRLQWKNHYNLCCITIRSLAFSHFVYNHALLFLLVLNRVYWCPFLSTHTCQNHKTLWTCCNTGPTFST